METENNEVSHLLLEDGWSELVDEYVASIT
jgi:hypothetical protein